MIVVASAARRARYCGTVTPPRVRVAEERLQRDRRRQLAGPDQRARDLEDAAMDRLEEMLRLQEVRHAVEGVVVDEDRAEQRLLGLDIVRGLPEGKGVQALFQRGSRGDGGKCGGASHERD